jgi:hypothetical protein
MFKIGGNTFYDQKNEIPMKIPEFKMSGIRIIAEFRRIPNGFPNQASHHQTTTPQHIIVSTHFPPVMCGEAWSKAAGKPSTDMHSRGRDFFTFEVTPCHPNK